MKFVCTKIRFCYTLIILCIAAYTLSGCATPPVAVPHEPGYGVLAVAPNKQGFILTTAKRDELVWRGIPPTYFEADGKNYFLSSEHASEAAQILIEKRNP